MALLPLKEMQSRYDVSRSTLMRHIRRGAPHAKQDGRLLMDAAEYGQWRKRYINEDLSRKNRAASKGIKAANLAPGPESILILEDQTKLPAIEESARIRAHYQAKLAELEYKQLLSKFVDRESVEREMIKAFKIISDRLLRMAEEVGPRVHAAQTKEEGVYIFDRGIREALTELSKFRL